MTEPTLHALYGLKYNPFLPNIPVEDVWKHPAFETFSFRVQSLLRTGGLALIDGVPGLGKSKFLHSLAWSLDASNEGTVGVMERPQNSLADFFRELGELYGVTLSVANRYGSFKALRARWREHAKSTLLRPVLLIDEAQAVPAECLNELRLLSSAYFDSENLMTTVLCGDQRLWERLGTRDLLPVRSRIRARVTLQPLTEDEMASWLDNLLIAAGAPHLLTDALRDALLEQAGGNPRTLANMGAELLDIGARRKLAQLDETLFVELYVSSTTPRARGARGGRKAR